ncbi:hypothetical protein ONZ51_g2087 [Trametes cubensis]|uniref:Uncharacterized protein n=1 Tax=Trametes cubensis TaxID=1111947 RepID=A0AAD7U1B9_9APHY|nr:hypothetical protein ONZ51_g2087 [Trametes cubensis]
MSEASAPLTPATDPNSSSSTLVNHPHPPPGMAPSTADADTTSPSSDPPQSDGVATPHATLRTIDELPTAGGTGDPLWTYRLSASFGTIAEQIAAASRALASVPAGPQAGGAGVVGETGLRAEVDALAKRLEGIERAQEAMSAQLKGVQETLGRLQLSEARARTHKEEEKGHQDNVTVEEVVVASRDGPGGDNATGGSEGEFKSPVEIAIEELQKKVEGVIETIKLDQARLYARLHNATVTVNKMAIQAPIMANGKTPPNFPNTKGEFEHLTKERYEALLKGYNLPIKGDTNAKREALREFIGLTPPA